MIHTVFITHNRLELTKRALESYFETITLPYTYVIVDNASEDGTQAWLLRQNHPVILLHENRYPGFAANAGFADAPAEARFLHRADNDFEFLPGWDRKVVKRFGSSRKLGQLGLRTKSEERSTINVGGNCVFARALWEKGLRYDERPWPQLRDEVGAGWTEDSLMSGRVRELGYHWARVGSPCIRAISSEEEDDDYYKQTWADRGIEK